MIAFQARHVLKYIMRSRQHTEMMWNFPGSGDKTSAETIYVQEGNNGNLIQLFLIVHECVTAKRSGRGKAEVKTR